MRRFIVLGHTQKAQAPVPLDDPAGAGRWDVFTRAVASALLLSNGIRRDTEIFLILLRAEPVKTIWIKSSEVRNLNPDDRSIQGLLTKALALKPVGAHPMESSPGVHLCNWDLEKVLTDSAAHGPVVLLHEMGLLLEHRGDIERIKDGTFVLSDHEEFSPEQLSAIRQRSQEMYSLGPMSLHTANCIAILHNFIDRLRA